MRLEYGDDGPQDPIPTPTTDGRATRHAAGKRDLAEARSCAACALPIAVEERPQVWRGVGVVSTKVHEEKTRKRVPFLTASRCLVRC